LSRKNRRKQKQGEKARKRRFLGRCGHNYFLIKINFMKKIEKKTQKKRPKNSRIKNNYLITNFKGY
jgi:hypothetical protein